MSLRPSFSPLPQNNNNSPAIEMSSLPLSSKAASRAAVPVEPQNRIFTSVEPEDHRSNESYGEDGCDSSVSAR